MAPTPHADDELARIDDLTRQEIVRRVVLERYRRAGRRIRVEQATIEMLDEWGDVLDRLGSV